MWVRHMSDSQRLDELLELLLRDQSPTLNARSLDPLEQRMLVLAQRIRGSQTQRPTPEFVRALHSRLRAADVVPSTSPWSDRMEMK